MSLDYKSKCPNDDVMRCVKCFQIKGNVKRTASTFLAALSKKIVYSGEAHMAKQPLNTSSALVISDNGFDISMSDTLQATHKQVS